MIQAGCKHCATNSMYNYFKQHPDITVNIKKPLKLAHLEKSEEALALYRTFFRPQPDVTKTQFAGDPTAARAERAVHHLKKVGKKKGVSSE